MIALYGMPGHTDDGRAGLHLVQDDGVCADARIVPNPKGAENF